ncbi:Predicted dehydrogenase [Pseudonocardia thermophila]|uniref:Predicted dehydrogenase n=1 Tax=Pseudonocardia thermophila TaxID=1848 RepID=A0A1M6WUW7_PSETH|nr:Gfo/Idh/MocA family oxidoreductase [Pseudonocardia thermophila]SHK97562.1 Predicted dehydrogenase [Pseudonocardia thermophila]
MAPVTVRWGVIGPGRIATKVVGDLPLVPGAELAAVASRTSIERAEAFAAVHGGARAYGSYQEIVADPDVDVLYIATPHPQHRAAALAGIAAGKALLVEKAFTVSAEAAREIVAAANEAGVFVMEAMWTRFQPAIVRMRELIADGAIGEVTAVQADLGIAAPTDPADRYYNPALGGGALFDVGVYPISFAQMVLGVPDTVAATGRLAPSGIDLEESVLFGYADGRSAVLHASIRAARPGQARVFGTGGWIDVPPRFHHPSRIVLHRAGAEPETIEVPATGGGYFHELVEVTEAVAAGRTESAVMPLADTLAVQELMDEIARQIGLVVQEGPAQL